MISASCAEPARAAVVDRDQTRLSQPLKQRRVRRGIVARGEFAWRDPALGVRGAVTDGDQAQEGPPEQGALALRAVGVDTFRSAGDGVRHTAGFGVRGQSQAAWRAVPPGLEQGVGDQRQSTGLAAGLGECGSDQGTLHLHPGLLGGLDDDVAKLAGVHGPDQHLCVAQRGHQSWPGGTVGVEVRTYAQHHAGTRGVIGHGGEQGGHEVVPLPAVAADGEQFLELVDDQQQFGILGPIGAPAPGPREFRHGQFPGREHDGDPVPRRVELAALDSRKQARPQQGGLPATRRSEDREEPSRHRPPQQVAG